MLHRPSKGDLYRLVHGKQYVEVDRWIKFIGKLRVNKDYYPSATVTWHLNTHDCFYHRCQRELPTYMSGFKIGYIHPITWECMVCNKVMPKSAKMVLKLKAMAL